MLIAFPQKKKLVALSGAAAVALAAGIGLAETASARAPSHASLQCSVEANAKGLHGKDRVEFRHHCLREAMKLEAEHHRHAASAEHAKHVAAVAEAKQKHEAAVAEGKKKHEASLAGPKQEHPHKKVAKQQSTTKPKTDKATYARSLPRARPRLGGAVSPAATAGAPLRV